MSERVFVTGLGLVTPLGCSVEAVWARLVAGESGIGPPDRYGAAKPPMRAVGEIRTPDLEALRAEVGALAESADVRSVFAVAAATRALEDAGISGGPHERAGVALGSGPGAHRPEELDPFVRSGGRLDEAARLRDDRVHPESLVRNASDRPATEVARRFGLRGPVCAPVTACAASSQAIGIAFRAVRSGRIDWMLAGGSDSQVDPFGLVQLVLLNAQAAGDRPPAEACRPFSRTRSGMVMGEGAALLVLESESHARRRGARRYAEVAGYGSSLDAWHPTAPHPQARGGVAAMTRALRDAGMAPDDVDHVAAHGTATRKSDPLEILAIRLVFGEHAARIAVSSIKSMMGHLLAAAGAATVAATVLAVQRDLVPPTINLDDPDPACAADHVRGRARRVLVRCALANAIAFGGHNACIALRKAS